MDNLLAAIERSKERPWPRVLYGLGIRHVGDVTAEALAAVCPSLDALLEADAERARPGRGRGPGRGRVGARVPVLRRQPRAAGAPPRRRADGGVGRAAAARGRAPDGAQRGHHRRTGGLLARRGQARRRRGRRQGDRFGEPVDRVRGGRRRPRARSSRRPSRRASRCSTRRRSSRSWTASGRRRPADGGRRRRPQSSAPAASRVTTLSWVVRAPVMSACSSASRTRSAAPRAADDPPGHRAHAVQVAGLGAHAPGGRRRW